MEETNENQNVQSSNSNAQDSSQNNTHESKKTIGVLCGLFLGLIGLIIGVCMYKEGSEERQTFMSGWIIAFICSIIIGVIVGIIYGIQTTKAINDIYNSFNY